MMTQVAPPAAAPALRHSPTGVVTRDRTHTALKSAPITSKSICAGTNVPDVKGPGFLQSSPHGPDRHWYAIIMTTVQSVSFDDERVLEHLEEATDDELDALPFGVIGFDSQGVVRRYNAFESKAAGLSIQRVVGNDLFTVVAPCMNNYLVAQRFEDAADDGSRLDATIDYVLTLRMRPVKVKLRLLAPPGATTRYVVVHRRD